MLVQHFSLQSMPETINVFTDSDWAGCRAAAALAAKLIDSEHKRLKFALAPTQLWHSIMLKLNGICLTTEPYKLSAYLHSWLTWECRWRAQCTQTSRRRLALPDVSGWGSCDTSTSAISGSNTSYIALSWRFSKCMGWRTQQIFVTKLINHHLSRSICGSWICGLMGGRAANALTRSSIASTP